MRRIAIIGAEIDEPDLQQKTERYECWSVNNLFEKWPDTKFDRWFELHTITEKDGFYLRRNIPWYPIYRQDRRVGAYLEDIARLSCPVYMQKRWPDLIPLSQEFPFQRYRDRWGDYWGCSFAWMTAMAIDERVDEIAYFGVRLSDHEYYYQRPSTERMIGIAEGMGIKITIDETSDLLRSNYIYAIGERFDMIYLLHGEMAKGLSMTMMTAVQDALERWGYGIAEVESVEETDSDTD